MPEQNREELIARLNAGRARNMARLKDRYKGIDEKIVELRKRGDKIMEIARQLEMRPSYVQKRLSELRQVDERISAIRKAVAALRADS